MFFDPQPWPVYIAWEGEKIDFAGGVKLKSEEKIDSNLLLPQITKYQGWTQKIYIDQQSAHQGFFGWKGVRIPTGPKVIIN